MAKKIKFDFGDFGPVARPVVSIKRSWDDEWKEKKHVFCDQLNLTTGGEGISEAQLSYSYSDSGKQIKDPGFAQHKRLDVVGHLVKVEVRDGDGKLLEDGEWIGRIVDDEDTRQSKDRGVQQFVALGLEWDLARKRVQTAWVLWNGDEIEIGRPVGFNRGHGRTESSTLKYGNNRSTIVAKRGGYMIEDDLADAERWRAGDMIEHLLNYHAPTAPDGRRTIKWETELADLDKLDWYDPSVETAGRSVWELVGSLASPQRLHDFWPTYKGDKPTLHFCSLSHETIKLDGKKQIDKNVNEIELITDGSPYVQPHTVLTTARGTFDAVTIRGAPIGVLFTARNQGLSLGVLNGWTDAEAATYAGGDAGVDDDASSMTKATAHDRWRQSAEVGKVYSEFDVGMEDGKTGDGKIWAIDKNRLDRPQRGGRTGAIWSQALRVAGQLVTLDGQFPSGPLVALERTAADSGLAMIRVDQAATLDLDQLGWSASVRPLRDRFGYQVQVSGQAQHAIASDSEHTYGITADYLSHTPTDTKWTGNGVATVFVELDDRIAAKEPPDIEALQVDAQSVLDIDLPQYRYDYVVPGTTTDVQNGVEVKTSDSGEGQQANDDREQLRNAAKVAGGWYGKKRKAIALPIAGITDRVRRGQMVVKLDGDEINSVVTGVTWDFSSQPQTTVIRTSFAEVDAVGIFQ